MSTQYPTIDPSPSIRRAVSIKLDYLYEITIELEKFNPISLSLLNTCSTFVKSTFAPPPLFLLGLSSGQIRQSV